MKKWIKYFISTVIFGTIYTIVESLLTKDINWKMVIVAIVFYAIVYTIIDLICNKSIKK